VRRRSCTFLVLSGPHGSGKTTICSILSHVLSRLRFSYIYIHMKIPSLRSYIISILKIGKKDKRSSNNIEAGYNNEVITKIVSLFIHTILCFYIYILAKFVRIFRIVDIVICDRFIYDAVAESIDITRCNTKLLNIILHLFPADYLIVLLCSSKDLVERKSIDYSTRNPKKLIRNYLLIREIINRNAYTRVILLRTDVTWHNLITQVLRLLTDVLSKL